MLNSFSENLRFPVASFSVDETILLLPNYLKNLGTSAIMPFIEMTKKLTEAVKRAVLCKKVFLEIS